MNRRILNIADVELQPRSAGNAATEFANGEGKHRPFRFVGRAERSADCWEGE